MTQPIWTTAAGSIGTYPSGIVMSYQLVATAVAPATTVSYQIISGSLPAGLTMTSTGLISGTPDIIPENTTSTFVVRATDDDDNIRDRTFNFTISGVASPEFTTPSGIISTIYDSTWFEFIIEYENLIETNPVSIRLIQGQLPPGIEINEYGLIRGYADPPIINVNLGLVTTSAVATSANTIICFSTIGFTVNRPIVFTGTVFGGVTESQTYYVHSIIDETTFTISLTSGGDATTLTDAVGNMAVTLPIVSIGEASIQTYAFTLKLESPIGSDTQSYSITVVNQNASSAIGGPGFPPNTRIPTILNTRPATFNISSDVLNYDFYKIPSDSEGATYATTDAAYIGRITSDNFFAFKILGHDFDTNNIEYFFIDLPLGLTGDTSTGWVSGTPIVSDNSISQFYFSVAVRKVSNTAITSPVFNFSFKIREGIDGEIEWVTPSAMGTLFNGSVSTEKVLATCDVDLSYRIIDGSLPPNLILLSNGEISGVVAQQPTSSFLEVGVTTDFTFTIEAYSPNFPVITSQRTFTLSIYQEYGQPTDVLYIKCTPSITDRELIDSLLEDTDLIPDEMIYREEDPFFGKASSVTYEHAYGIYASSFDEYVAAVTRNHYWRQVTLGELKTAVAKNSAGEIIYEVVYSEVIDNLINPEGLSVPQHIVWPRSIPLNLGPWYASSTEIYSSYEEGPDGFDYVSSLTPGVARDLYPNSLPNMRARVGDELGQLYNSNLLPKWMTSQQADGSTTGFISAWVICYTKPGYSETIKTNIETNWVDVLGRVKTLNTVNFKIDRFTVDKSTTFNYDTNLVPPAWTGLPSASPTPDPKDSNDFYVLAPRPTILPDETQ